MPMKKETSIEYPIRINRYLYLTNFCSRRKADELIEMGLIKINGQKAVLGQKITLQDKVEIDQKIQGLVEKYEYYIFHKPRGVVSHNPQEGEKSVENFFPPNLKLSPVGRLDKDSTGLMFLTNDGRVVDKMLNPKYDHDKEYEVRVQQTLKESFKNKMEKGVNIEGYKTKPCVINITGEKSFKIILTEGKKHQIRRMCAALGYTISGLKRTRILNLKLNELKEGEKRKLEEEEKNELLKKIKII